MAGTADPQWGKGRSRPAPIITVKALVLSGLMICLALGSCAQRKAARAVKNQPVAASRSEKSSTGKTAKGVWHTVEPGQTFYRICKTYAADPNAVAKANHISDPAQINVGQRLFIPGAKQVLKVEPYPGFKGNPAPSSHQASAPAGREPQAPEPAVPKPGSVQLLWPVPNGILFSPYGNRNGVMHDGVDISAPAGSPVLAADDGKVTYSGNTVRGYGNMVVIKHAGNLLTVYAHNKKNLVREGDLVRRGQRIAEVGETGRATGSHCHFEVRVGKQAVNPLFYLKETR
jgi:murein DD-endopeptidase MepM/ murein hydrolase activator NlpD